MRCRLFIDFWNLSLQWNGRAGHRKIDWKKLPLVLCGAAEKKLAAANLGNLQLEETRVYASYDTEPRGMNLKQWLNNFLDKQAGFRVFTFERRWRQKPIHCRYCKTDLATCPACDKPFGRAVEKAVDSRIVTDMLSLAWEDTYEVALLVTSDMDMVPAVECLQAKNFKVVNATWRGHGHNLAKTSWASFELDDLVDQLARESV